MQFLISVLVFIVALAGNTQAETECVDKQLELSLLLDDSGSVSEKEFAHMKSFLISIIQQLVIGPKNTQVAMMTFGTYAFTNFKLKTHVSKSGVIRAIAAAPQRKQTKATNTHLALNALLRLMDRRNGGRTGAKRMAIVLTDGNSKYPTKTKESAATVKSKGISLIAVGLGEYNTREIGKIATNSKHIFTMADQENLMKLLEPFTVAASCQGSLTGTCPDKFIHCEGKSYFFGIIKKTMSQAEEICKSMGAALVSIESYAEDQFLMKEAARLDKDFASIEGFFTSGKQKTGHWEWTSTNKALDYKGWFPGEPASAVVDNCLILWQGHAPYWRWGDINCNFQAGFICER